LRGGRVAWLVALAVAASAQAADRGLIAPNEAMFRQLQQAHGTSDEAMRKVRDIFTRSGFAGQGNSAISRHPLTEDACRESARQAGIHFQDPESLRICQAPYMAPLYDPAHQKAEEATACIDQFEFPDVPCAYPVVWVKASEAAQICEAMGKRLCDAHEWEGACAGSLEPPDYAFDLARGRDPETAIGLMREAHNVADAPTRSWSYGPKYRTGVCATASHKTPGCPGGGWSQCGSNTYPAGSFPECRSALGAYDLNGNAAEHMNLPLSESQMASRGSREYGYTEMKGSWFTFDDYRAHEDWCRWRAPFWHGSRVMDPHSHANYHLGFRCCKTIAAGPVPPVTASPR
jgi:formylglycine-generating enzyme required for sulfatase activity